MGGGGSLVHWLVLLVPIAIVIVAIKVFSKRK